MSHGRRKWDIQLCLFFEMGIVLQEIVVNDAVAIILYEIIRLVLYDYKPFYQLKSFSVKSTNIVSCVQGKRKVVNLNCQL